MACLAIVLDGPKTRNGRKVFEAFQLANQQCFWNRELMNAANALVYMGFVRPSMLFVSAPEEHLQSLKTAWARRILKAPERYQITSVGDLGEIQRVEQMHFVPLGDMICDVIAQLNRLGQPTTLLSIRSHVSQHCPQVAPPSIDMVRQTINSLVSTGLLYNMGDHYFVSIPTQTPPKAKQTVECQTGQSMMQPNPEQEKKQRKGFIARLFSKRSSHSPTPLLPSPHPMVFSTQFPPPQWVAQTKDKPATATANLVHNKFPTYHDRLCEQTARPEEIKHRRRRHDRRQLSSSSECLNYGPIDPPECLPGHLEVVDDLRNRRRRRERNHRRVPIRTSTPVGSDSAYSPSPVTDSNEDQASWSEPEERMRSDPTYMNVAVGNDSTQFEDISASAVNGNFDTPVPANRVCESEI